MYEKRIIFRDLEKRERQRERDIKAKKKTKRKKRRIRRETEKVKKRLEKKISLFCWSVLFSQLSNKSSTVSLLL